MFAAAVRCRGQSKDLKIVFGSIEIAGNGGLAVALLHLAGGMWVRR